jgi:CRP-like cAMP-binding protein
LQAMSVDIEILKSINYFAGLEYSELSSIRSYLTEKQVAKGEKFISQGEWCGYLFFLISGLVKVYKTSPVGKEQILHIAPPGDSLNDVSTFSGGVNQSSMLAMTPVLLYGITRGDVHKILQEHPVIYNNIIKAFADRIRRDAKMVEELSFNQVMARLAKLLMGKFAGEESTIGLSLTQQDMADLIGSCREVVNRSLKIMEEKGAIKLGRRKVRVLKKEILAELADS